MYHYIPHTPEVHDGRTAHEPEAQPPYLRGLKVLVERTATTMSMITAIKNSWVESIFIQVYNMIIFIRNNLP